MKLSEIKGERCFDIIGELIEPLINIAASDEVKAIFQKTEKDDNMSIVELFLSRLKENLPALIKSHKKEFIKICAIMEETTSEEYVKALTIPKLIIDVYNIVNDKEFRELFISARKNAGSSSSCAQENIAE